MLRQNAITRQHQFIILRQLTCNRDVVYIDASMRRRAGSIGYVNDCPDEFAVPVRSISGRCPYKAQAQDPGAE